MLVMLNLQFNTCNSREHKLFTKLKELIDHHSFQLGRLIWAGVAGK